jgi:hypothetical protein
MAKASDSVQNIGELIDEIERIREELLAIQRSMEKLESAKANPAKNDDKK